MKVCRATLGGRAVKIAIRAGSQGHSFGGLSIRSAGKGMQDGFGPVAGGIGREFEDHSASVAAAIAEVPA